MGGAIANGSGGMFYARLSITLPRLITKIPKPTKCSGPFGDFVSFGTFVVNRVRQKAG